MSHGSAAVQLPYRQESPDRLSLRLRVTPNSAKDRIEGIETLADGRAVLKLRVRARPQDGEANEAVLALLAKALEIRRSALSLTSGAMARVKTVTATGDAARLIQRLAEFESGS